MDKVILLTLACLMYYFRKQVVEFCDYYVFSDTDAACWLCGHPNRVSSNLRYFECGRCGMDNGLFEGRGVIPPIKIHE
jgi:hypothetical protein